jgi:hypothetical protein
MEVKRSSKAIRIRSPSMTIPCSIKGTIVEALHDPTVEVSIMSEFQEKTLLGDTHKSLGTYLQKSQDHNSRANHHK